MVLTVTFQFVQWGGNSSAGRVQKNGTTYALATSGKPPYTEKSWTTPGTYTFTVPQGVTRIRVAVCGGWGGSNTEGDSTKAKSGGTSSAFGVIATGGRAGYLYYFDEGVGSFVNPGGTPNGYDGHKYSRYDKYTKGFALSFDLKDGDYGKGGGMNGYGYVEGASSGGYDSQYVNVTPLQTYTIVVGAGGVKYDDGVDGTNGFVLIAFGGDI